MVENIQLKDKNVLYRFVQGGQTLEKLEPQLSSFELEAWTRPKLDSFQKIEIRLRNISSLIKKKCKLGVKTPFWISLKSTC